MISTFFLFMFGLCFLPAKYLPTEISIIYLIEVVNRNIYYIFSGSFVLLLTGEFLRGLRGYENAILELKPDKMSIVSKSETIDLEYGKIKKFYGYNNLVHGLKSMEDLNFIIKMNNNTKIEIRSHKKIFNGLTDFFPKKI